jgi:hypothetical protein
MSVPIEPVEVLTLSAQRLRAASVSVDAHTTALFLTDGEDAVEISHEIGRPEAAATRLAEAGRAMLAHAEAVRRAARAGASRT